MTAGDLPAELPGEASLAWLLLMGLTGTGRLEDWGAGWGSVVVRGVRVLAQWKTVLKYFKKHTGRLIFFIGSL